MQAKIFYDHVKLFHDHQLVLNYRRRYGSNEEIYDLTQYVATLCKKPRAVERTRFFHHMPQPWQPRFEQSRGKDWNNALQLLQEIVRDVSAVLCDDVLELA